MPEQPTTLLAPAYYHASVAEFLSATDHVVMGQMATNNQFGLDPEQKNAWIAQLPILRKALKGITGMVYLEFDVPRLGSRIDAVLIAGAAIFPIEFKVGETKFVREHHNQAWDYALDLKNFHKASHSAPIFPMLVATGATRSESAWLPPHDDGVYPPARMNADGMRTLIDQGLAMATGTSLDSGAWGNSSYQPTPTIIEAAQSLYARHSVDAISRHDAGARNLGVTSACVEGVVEDAACRGRKAIVFVTGVPGAGKTLVGLNVATRKQGADDSAHAVFLSGNGPLVAVLREALARDEVARQKRTKPRAERERKGVIMNSVKAFIQNVHHFRDAGLRDAGAPDDHVVIFDEAQRAWNLEQTRNFMKRKRQRPNFNQSEPEFLLSYMDRRDDWAVVICLVGGGQEINTGEAGISAWLDAVREHFPSWDVYVSPALTDAEYAAGHALDAVAQCKNLKKTPDLHLAVSMRSFRAGNVSSFVKAALDCDGGSAMSQLRLLSAKYPLALTRDLTTAKRWVRSHARGTERYGLVASSAAKRLKPHAIDVRVEIDPIHWFLNEPNDTRSSFYLEDAATEFQIQGLELDWICMTWDADLRYEHGAWKHFEFRGDRWTTMRQPIRQKYLLNAYRVLLTRARQGMVIFVPPGDSEDHTREPAFYDGTFQYLLGLGIDQI